MRVVLVSRIYAPEPGAAALRLSALARALTAAGHQVRVLTSTVPPGIDDKVDDSVEIRRARVLRDRSGYIRGYVQYLSFDIPLFFRLLFTRGLDLVVTEPPPTTGVVVRLASAIRRRPYVYYAADVWSDAAVNATRNRLVLRTLRAIERWAWQGAAVVLSVSTGVTRRLEESGVRARIATVGNGIDVSRFSSHGERAEFGGPYFVYAGTASEIQGAGIFIEAVSELIAEHPDLRLVYVGSGTERRQLESAAHLLPDGVVRFLPRSEPEEVARIMRGCVASLASLRPGTGYDYAFPTKLYASVACGAPVIYAGTGPGRDFIADGPSLGHGVDHDVRQVVEAMRDELRRSGDESRRTQIADWAERTVSAERSASLAVDAILAAHGGRVDNRNSRRRVRS